MKKEKTLKEHMSEIAKKRQDALRKKLGVKGYRDLMASISSKRRKK